MIYPVFLPKPARHISPFAICRLYGITFGFSSVDLNVETKPKRCTYGKFTSLKNSRTETAHFPGLFRTCSFLSSDCKDFWQMIWKWIINLMLGRCVKSHSIFLHCSHKEVFTSRCIFAALLCFKDTPSATSETPCNFASTWTGNPVKFLKRKAITGFLGEKAAC